MTQQCTEIIRTKTRVHAVFGRNAGVLRGLSTLQESGVKPRWVVIDDGWQHTTNDDALNGEQWDERLLGLEANKRFRYCINSFGIKVFKYAKMPPVSGITGTQALTKALGKAMAQAMAQAMAHTMTKAVTQPFFHTSDR